MHIFNIKFFMQSLGAVAIAFAIAACGGGGSSGGSAAAPSTTDSAASSPNGSNSASTAIDPVTGSVAAAEVTCQGACVSLSADAGTSTE